MKFSEIEIAKDLIRFKSVTPDQAGAIDYIETLLKENGFEIFKIECGPLAEKVTNIYAYHGEEGPNLCFAGHIDVVPTGNLAQWKTKPFEPVIDKDRLYGRGAVDMKGAVAASIAAILNYKNNNSLFGKRLSLLITSDEEGPGIYGTKAILPKIYSQGHKLDFTIIGEPTCDKKFGDIIKIGRRGSINFELTIKGVQGHVAYPHLALNPHINLPELLNQLINYRFDNGNDFFSPTNLEITSIDTNNPTRNIIPEEVKILLNIRFNDIHSETTIVKKITDIISSCIKSKWYLKHNCSSKPFISKITSFKKNFQNIVEKITEVKPSFDTSGGTSDARFIKDYCDFLEFGLQNFTAHKIDEYCEINDLQKLSDVYYMAVDNFIKTLV